MQHNFLNVMLPVLNRNRRAAALFVVCFMFALTLLGQQRSTVEDRIINSKGLGARLLPTDLHPPGGAESEALLAALHIGKTNILNRRISDLEQFVAAHPNSSWTPSVRGNLALFYRSTGRYTRALAHWEQAWEATKQFQSGPGRTIADSTLAHWSELLSSLGRVEKLRELHALTTGRVLSDLEWERKFAGTRRNLATMESQPGISYQCGTLALMNVGLSMSLQFDVNRLKEIPSPATGFSMAQLADLANQFKLDLVPVRRPEGSGFIVPSVIHLRQNHYAAIVAERKGLYRVTDPTFGRAIWLTRDALEEEASGYFLVPRSAKPSAWTTPTLQEQSKIFGKGQDTSPPYPPPPPCEATPEAPDACPTCKPGGPNGSSPGPSAEGCTGCGPSGPGLLTQLFGESSSEPTIGMPTWTVLEPHISVQLRDVPVGYSPGRGSAMNVKMYYGGHEERTTNYFGFGPQWASSLLSYIRMEDSSGSDDFTFADYYATLFGIGGGVAPQGRVSGIWVCCAGFVVFYQMLKGAGALPTCSVVVGNTQRRMFPQSGSHVRPS